MPPGDEAEQNPVGAQLALELLHAIQESNKNANATREVLIELRDLMEKDAETRGALLEATDELCGRLEVLSVTADIIADVSGNGKRVDLADFTNAINQATKEVFPDDEDGGDDDDEDDPDAGDPVGPIAGRKSGRRKS